MLDYNYFTNYLSTRMFCSCLIKVPIFHCHHSAAVSVPVRGCWVYCDNNRVPHSLVWNSAISVHRGIAGTAWIRADYQSPLLYQDYFVLEAISCWLKIILCCLQGWGFIGKPYILSIWTEWRGRWLKRHHKIISLLSILGVIDYFQEEQWNHFRSICFQFACIWQSKGIINLCGGTIDRLTCIMTCWNTIKAWSVYLC